MPMKTLFFVVLVALLLRSDAKALFGHTAAERDRRVKTEQQLVQEQQRTGLLIRRNEHLHVIISILSAGAVVMLITGTAIGSHTRRNHV